MAEAGSPRGKRVLSGVQPTGVLHLGNYFGAMRQQIALQEQNTVLLFIADYHSLTAISDPEARRAFSQGIALDYLALGLDPERAILYRQSDLPEVTELAWILGTVTPMGLLERAHSYKDKLAHGLAADLGLFSYPVLQAADILIHRSDLVPVGQDQKQHIEMTRDIAGKFNRTYGPVLTIPDPFIVESVAVVPGTDGRKMSKTYGNTVQMFAPASRLRKQIMGIVTDSTPVEDPKNPEASDLFALWKLFADASERVEMEERFRKGGLGYGELKKDLVTRVMDHFAAARQQRERLAQSPDSLEAVLERGAERARTGARRLMAEVRRATGLGRA